MKLKFVLLFMVAIFVLGGQACHKEKPLTVINGKAIDKFTGLPIEDVRVEFVENVNYKDIIHSYKYSDSLGLFYFSSNFDTEISSAYKPGYVYKKSYPGGIIPITEEEKTNKISLSFIPEDAFLRLRLENIPGLPDSIYIVVHSPIRRVESGSAFANILEEKYSFPEPLKEIIIPAASNQMLGIYWGFTPLPTQLSNSAFVDSVFITKNDTVNYTISF
ncbi:MAG: hypothetical protein R3A50_13985 [Saprospiraceae bacterium]